MKIYDAVRIRKRELLDLEASVGGKIGIIDRFRKGGIGSPMVYYLSGSEALDKLQGVSSDEIRINFELFKDGIFLRVSERTNPYFIPVRIEDIVSIRLFQVKNKTSLNLLMANGDHLKFWGHAGIFSAWDLYLRGNILESKRRLFAS